MGPPKRLPENAAAIHDLARGLSDRLTAEQQSWGDEFLTQHEWGLTLEMFADWLSEESLPVATAEREVFREGS